MSKISAIITGATGMVGKAVLLECLESDHVEKVLLVNRKPIGITHPKLTEVLVEDFMNLTSIEQKMVGYNACYFCMGVSVAGLSEIEYSKVTFDITTHFAATFLKINPNSSICYVSGAGTDSTENGNAMWARVKGRTENALLHMGFKNAYMFRPGYIQPLKGIRSKTKLYDYTYRVFGFLYFFLKHFPSLATNTTHMGKAMINVVRYDANLQILRSQEINFWALK